MNFFSSPFFFQSKRFTPRLVCWYKTNHPLLVLKPARLERLYPKPELIYFRQAMSDKEIERIKTLAINMVTDR